MAIETWSPENSSIFTPQKPEGEGWTVTGYRDVRTPNPKHNSGYVTSQVPIYSRTIQEAPPPAPAPPPPPAPAPVAAPAPVYTPPSQPAISPIRTPTLTPPPATGPDFGAMMAQMQAQSQAQLEAVMAPLLQTISDMQKQLADEAGAREEDARRMAELQRTAQINQARAQSASNLQIQPAGGETPKGGTSAFKIRPSQDYQTMTNTMLPTVLNI